MSDLENNLNDSENKETERNDNLLSELKELEIKELREEKDEINKSYQEDGVEQGYYLTAIEDKRLQFLKKLKYKKDMVNTLNSVLNNPITNS